MQISHGYEITDARDPYLAKANEFVENFADASLPGRWLVDWLPFCKACLAGSYFAS